MTTGPRRPYEPPAIDDRTVLPPPLTGTDNDGTPVVFSGLVA